MLSLVVNLFVFGFLLGINISDGCMCDTLDQNRRYCQADAVVGVILKNEIIVGDRKEYNVTVWHAFRPGGVVSRGSQHILRTSDGTSCERELALNRPYAIGVSLNQDYMSTDYCSFFIDLKPPADIEHWAQLPDCSTLDTDSDAVQQNTMLQMPQSQREKKDVASIEHNNALEELTSRDAMQQRDEFGPFEPVASEKKSAIPDKRNDASDTHSYKVLRDLLDAFDTLSKRSTDPVARNVVNKTQRSTRKALRDLLYEIIHE